MLKPGDKITVIYDIYNGAERIYPIVEVREGITATLIFYQTAPGHYRCCNAKFINEERKLLASKSSRVNVDYRPV